MAKSKSTKKKPAVKVNDLRATKNPKGGGKALKPQRPDGSLDAGLHFKYDIKGQKEG
jgi:hypothetical protein